MKRTIIVMIPFLCTMLVLTPFSGPVSFSSDSQMFNQTAFENAEVTTSSHELEALTGTLNPVLVEHFGAASAVQPYSTGRTDTDPTPSSEVFFPAGVQGNYHSVDCSGGHFLVGSGGSADFGSSQGTISLWIKWDVSAPNGRFWGQHVDFETRWSSNRLTLDWGGDTSIVGTKSDWTTDKWYFLAITWDDSTNQLALFWGDEDTEPIEDASTSSWTDSVMGFHSENDIMNSAARTTTQVDGHVDDFRYYTVERSLEDIRSDYRTTLTGTEPGLSSYYHFEEVLTDSSGGYNLVAAGGFSFSHDVFSSEDGWRAEQIEMNIGNLDRLYVLEGTFESGNPGTNVDWIGDGTYYADGWLARREVLNFNGRQRSSYIDTGSKYIIIENEGYEVTAQNGYRHYNGTYIYWYQTVDNIQREEDFQFDMKYWYEYGPIGTSFSDIFEFGFDVLNGTSVLWNWSIDTTNITQRKTWYSTGPISVNIPDAPSQFEVRIRLRVTTELDFIQISETDGDLHGEPSNGRYITLYIDDVSFISLHSPSLQEVDLNVSILPIGTFPLLSATGQGMILLNHSFWERASIPFSFSSNTSISFEYQAKISKMTRFYNSTYSTYLEDQGVAYSIGPGESVDYSLYTYIQSSPEATGRGFIVHYPTDWNNPHVENPFGQDITNDVIVESGSLKIPAGFAESAGWWKVTFNGPNYAETVYTQTRDDYDITWVEESRFNCGEKVRCRAQIGTELHSVDNALDVEVTWYLPSGNEWSSEIIGNQNASVVTSNAVSLGPINATVGEWTVCISWCNGSEVGYGYTTFELYHQFTIFANSPNIEIEAGDEFTVAIYLYDQDNGNSILEGANVEGNWSSTTVAFNPNLAKGWWEADFNSTSLAPGTHAIIIEVEMPFYEASSTTVSIRIPSDSLYAITFRATLVGALLVLATVFAIVISRRFYTSITAKRNVELISLEGRIDDAKNLLGLLVIHRAIGLPVYSKIIKGGFQEALLSSFISAISNFRSEFSMDEPIWTSIPITEVIMAVQTNSLICAIITIEPASYRQRTRLEAFGREVGGLYDHEDDTMRTMVRTPSLNGTFEAIFESYFDGQLMKKYVGIKKNLPKHLYAVSRALDSMEIDHGVSVEGIIKEVSMLGYSERKAHKIVFESVDQGYLIAAEKTLPPLIDEEE